MKKTVVFDFDGVIHSYTSGWKEQDMKLKKVLEMHREMKGGDSTSMAPLLNGLRAGKGKWLLK